MPLPQAPPIACPKELGPDVELRIVRNDGWVMASHWHLRPQVFCTLGGQGEVLVGRHPPVRVGKGALVFVPSGAPHTAYGVSGGEWMFYSFLFPAAASVLPSYTSAGTLFAKTDPAASAFATLVAAIFGKGWHGCSAAMRTLLARLDEGDRLGSEDDGASAEQQLVLTSGSIAQAAERAGVSAAHFSRRFAEHHAISPLRWRLNAQLEHALELLRAGSSVSGAATSANFRDSSHLARHCRAMTGLTPRNFLRRREAD